MKTNNIKTVILNSFQHLRLNQTLNKEEEILNQFNQTPYYNLTGRGPVVKAAVQDDNIGRTARGFTPLVTPQALCAGYRGGPHTISRTTTLRDDVVCGPRGFTLIELLVVVLIIGILAAVAVPQYQKAVEKSRLVEALHNINAIQKCFDLYRLENGIPSGTYVHLKDMNCPIEANLGELRGKTFVGNHFDYHSIGCDRQYCHAEITRIPSFAYSLVMSRNENICFTQKSDLGRYICKSIENQGWAYVDEEF